MFWRGASGNGGGTAPLFALHLEQGRRTTEELERINLELSRLSCRLDKIEQRMSELDWSARTVIGDMPKVIRATLTNVLNERDRNVVPVMGRIS
jgi:hypothetical protein